MVKFFREKILKFVQQHIVLVILIVICLGALGVSAYLVITKKDNNNAALLSRIKTLEKTLALALEKAQSQKAGVTQAQKKNVEQLEGLAQQVKKLQKKSGPRPQVVPAQQQKVSDQKTAAVASEAPQEQQSTTPDQEESMPTAKMLEDIEQALSDVIGNMETNDSGDNRSNSHEQKKPQAQSVEQKQEDGKNLFNGIVINTPNARKAALVDQNEPEKHMMTPTQKPRNIQEATQVINDKISYDVQSNCREQIAEIFKDVFATAITEKK